MIVYKVTSPSNKCYIGISKHDLCVRKSGHLRSAKSGSNLKFHKALRKYKDCMVWEVLDSVESWEDAQRLEIFYIAKFDSFKSGYNSTLGGDGQLGVATMLGKTHSKASKQRISQSNSGKKKPPGFSEKMSSLHTGRIQDKKHVLSCLSSRGCDPFLVYKSNSMEFVGEFYNQTECARVLQLNPCLISGCLTTPNKNKSHRGYIFKYK